MDEPKTNIQSFFETVEDGDLVRLTLDGLHWLLNTNKGYEVDKEKAALVSTENCFPERGIRRIGSLAGYFCADESRLIRRNGTFNFSSLTKFPDNYMLISPFDCHSAAVPWRNLGGIIVPISTIADYTNMRVEAQLNGLQEQDARRLFRTPLWPDSDASRNLYGKIKWGGLDA